MAPADRLLNTVLQQYQDLHDAAKTDQIIGSTVHLLTELENPLNLGVLTSQLLTAPAIWFQPGGVRTAVRVISIYNTAAIRVHDHEFIRPMSREPRREGLRCEVWTRAVVKGADERSKRWQHLLMLTGVLMGMEGNNRQSLSSRLKDTLEGAVVTAANMALETHVEDGPVAGASVVMALNFAFPLLSDFHRRMVNCDALLPLVIWTLTAEEGFGDGHFLEVIGAELAESPTHQLAWSPATPSFRLLKEIERKPVVANLGPLSKLAAFAVQGTIDPNIVLHAQDSLLMFSRKVHDAWQMNNLSNIDPTTEKFILTSETHRTTWPVLWALLKKLMFGVVVILQPMVSRCLIDPFMLTPYVATGMATKSLRILRNLFFISSRDGNNGFQVYEFTYLASLDVLNQDAEAAATFLRSCRNAELPVATSQLQRTLDLFYLNVAEHMPLTLPTDACDALIMRLATQYISYDGEMTPSMVALFESAHSAALSVLSCPQHSALTIRIAPFYIVKLFESFPRHIASRQFRLAFKTVMQIVSPPFPIAEMEPHMSETLLEMLRDYTMSASPRPLPPRPDPIAEAAGVEKEPMSQQSTFALGLVDSLPFVPIFLLQDWLMNTAEVMNSIADPVLREPVKKRFIDVLVSGEMDVERGAIGLAWWGTQGGREMVHFGGAGEPVMSGAIGGSSMASRM